MKLTPHSTKTWLVEHKTKTFQLKYGIVLTVSYENSKIVKKVLEKDSVKLEIVKPEFFEFIKKENPFLTQKYNKEGNYAWVDNFIVDYEIDDLANLNYDNVIEIRNKDHTIRDFYGKPHSIVLNLREYKYDYVFSSNKYDYVFSSNKYYLYELLKFLKTSNFVVNGNELCVQKGRESERYIIDVEVYIPQNIVNEIYVSVGKFTVDEIFDFDVLNTNQFKK